KFDESSNLDENTNDQISDVFTIEEEDQNDPRNEIFLNNEFDEDFNLAGRNIHPADNTSAKWNLVTLFVDNLESPTYLTNS
ncbi:16808_t:CDS:2, partial [Racocetra fulgida]